MNIENNLDLILQFTKERDEAVLTLDKDTIISFCQKYQVPIPKKELSFWAGIHKTICQIPSASPEQKKMSEAWLIEHGFNIDIKNV